jgi:hypothetical protein
MSADTDVIDLNIHSHVVQRYFSFTDHFFFEEQIESKLLDGR